MITRKLENVVKLLAQDDRREYDHRVATITWDGNTLKEVTLFSAGGALTFPGDSIQDVLEAVAAELGWCCHEGVDQDCPCYQAGEQEPRRPLGK